MANTILLKKSGTANAVPVPGDLALGEVALNYTDGNLFYKDGGGTVNLLVSNKFVSVTGNITGGNLNAVGLSLSGNVLSQINSTSNITTTGNISGNYFIGNGSQLTGIIASVSKISNGTSEANIGTSGGNANISINGVSNVVVVTTTGLNITGTVSANGNITGGNIAAGSGTISTSGNITGGNVLYGSGIISGTGNATFGNLTVSSGPFTGNVDVSGNISAQANIIGGNVLAGTGVVSTSGNITGGNLIAGSGVITTTGNITGGNILAGSGVISTGGNVNGAIFNGNVAFSTGTVSGSGNITGGNIAVSGVLLSTNTVSATGNVIGGNINTGGNVSTSGNVIAQDIRVGPGITGGTISALGNITSANTLNGAGLSLSGNVVSALVSAANITTTANISANYFLGNGSLLTGIITSVSNINNGNSNVNISGPASNVTVSVSGVGNVAVFSPTGLDVTGTISANGNVTGGNVNTAGLISASGNITGGNITTTGSGGNISGANVISGVTLSASGNVIGGNVVTAGAVSAASVSASANITGGNLITSAAVSAASVSASGNITGGNLNAAGLSLSGNIVSTLNASSSIAAGTTVLAVGNVTGGNLITAGAVSAASVSASANIIGANLVTAGNVFASAMIANTVNDTRISLGTASGIIAITSTGNTTQFGPGGQITLGGASQIIGGTFGGSGITLGTSQTDIFQSRGGNVTVQVGSGGTIANTWTFAQNGSLTSPGALSAVGNVIGGNIITAADVSAASVSASGNVIGGNINTAGKVTTANINSATTITVTTGAGDINLWPTAGNIHLANTYINHVASPVQAFDAATKQYVDDAVSTGITIHTPVYVESPIALAATYAQGGTTHTVTDITGNATLTFSATHSLNVNDQIYWGSTFNGITANTSYFVYSAPTNTQITLASIYGGPQLTNLTNGTGLSQVGRANPGVGATLTANTNGAANIDGVLVTSSQRVLIYTQTNAAQNGVYVVTDAGNVSAPWVFTRSSDTNTYQPASINGLDAGDYFFVQAGDTGAGESYVLTAPVGEIILGYDNLTFTQFSASQVYSAGNGLTLTGTVFSVNVDNNTTAISGGNVVVKASANLTTPNIGAATGTSLSVTGNITGGNLNAAGLSLSSNVVSALNVTSNIAGGNITTPGLISATGNINGANIIASAAMSAASVSASGNITGGNLNAAGLSLSSNVVSALNVTGSIAGGNVTTPGLVSAGGNITGGNILFGSGIVSGTGNITGGNLNAAGLSLSSNVVSALNVTGNITGGNVNGVNGVYSGGVQVLTINDTVDGGTY